MNKLKTMGLTALAGTLAATTAQSVEMSVSGSVSVNYATDDTTETTGARFTTGDLSVSGVNIVKPLINVLSSTFFSISGL